MTLLEHEVPADFTPPTTWSSVNTLRDSVYAVAWDHMIRPVRVPCGQMGHFPLPGGGCFYGCEGA